MEETYPCKMAERDSKSKFSPSKVYIIKHYIVLFGKYWLTASIHSFILWNIYWVSTSSQILKLVMKIHHVNKTDTVHVLMEPAFYSDFRNNCKSTIVILKIAEEKNWELWEHGRCNMQLWVAEDRGMISETSQGRN